MSAEASASGRRSDRTRVRILDAALEVLAVKGYAGTTIADVATAAGLSRAGVQHHYPDTDQLVVAALDHRNLRNARATHVIDTEEPDELFDAIVQMMELNTWMPELIRAYSILSGESVSASHPAHEWFSRHYDRLRTNIAAVLAKGAARGTLRADFDAQLVALQLIALMEGTQILWLHNPDAVDLRAVIADAVQRLRRDLAPGRP